NISDNNLEHSSTETNNSSNKRVEKYVVSLPKNNKQKAKSSILSCHIRNSKKKVFYDVNKNRMFCTLCMAHGQKNEFAKATK
ncbi:3852_t:CDS:2, partial [Funneliformis caledonium]